MERPQSPETSDIDRIESGLNADRAELAESLDTLRDRAAPAALLRDGGRAAIAGAMPLAQSLARHVARNPLPWALIGAGAAWLAFSSRGAPAKAPEKSALAGTKFEAVSRWEDEGGPVAPEPPDPDESWMAEAEGLRTRAAEMIGRINAAARDRLAPAADLARSKAEVLAALTADVRAAMGRGLEGLTGQAREKALAAREAAYSARIAVAEKGAEQMRDHPFLSAGLLAGVGAALGALIPRSGTEQKLTGALRDGVMSAVQALAADEIDRASALARDLATELRREQDRHESTQRSH
jgi:ElaB/YqjD/DUF883 family membrane-anchored ribosome-binding protein